MNTSISIIPKPLSVKVTNNTFGFPFDSVSIHTNTNNQPIQKQMERAFTISDIKVSNKGFPVNIQIKKFDGIASDEEYRLTSYEKEIQIQAQNFKGAFYACISAAQIIFSCKDKLPEFIIEDKPACSWRGFLLDTSRSFYSTDFIKKMLDACALHKLNLFHWHLTDDQDWSFEVPAYPRLTSIGSKRQALTMPPSEESFYHLQSRSNKNCPIISFSLYSYWRKRMPS